MRVVWYYVAAMWREFFPAYQEREQKRMLRARVARLRRFGDRR